MADNQMSPSVADLIQQAHAMTQASAAARTAAMEQAAALRPPPPPPPPLGR